MDYCDVDRDGKINYSEFANFLNWKDKMPMAGGMEHLKISFLNSYYRSLRKY